MAEPLPRSPEMMHADDTVLLVVDAQEKLLPVVPDRKRIVWNIRRLLDGAKVLGVRTAVTEQYPEKLGPTEPTLAKRLGLDANHHHANQGAANKLAFSCGECGELFADWRNEGIHRVLICGLETHVCIQQSVLDLLASGYQVLVAADAVGTRHPVDHEIALRRMEASGALLATTESALFEWCIRAGTAEFKQISALVKEQPP